jgi:hypothetical protein
MSPHRTARRIGISMVELLVVLALLGFLLALLLPAVQKVRQAAARAQTLNNLKQMALALHNCNDVYKRLPPAFDKFAGFKTPESVHVYLLPFIEQDNLYRQYLNGQGKDLDKQIIPVFTAPADPSLVPPAAGVQDLAANLRVFSDKGLKTKFDAPMPALGRVEPGSARIPATFVDGTSNTMVFATRYGVCGEGGSRYASPPNTNSAAFFGQNPAKVKASPTNVSATYLLHPDPAKCPPTPLMAHSFGIYGIEVALADGSVRVVSARVSPHTWNAAVQPNDGETLGDDWDE